MTSSRFPGRTACPGWCRYRTTGHPLDRSEHVSDEVSVLRQGTVRPVATMQIQQHLDQDQAEVVCTFAATRLSLPEAKFMATMLDALVGDYWANAVMSA